MYLDAMNVDNHIEYVDIELEEFNKQKDKGWLSKMRGAKSSFAYPASEAVVNMRYIKNSDIISTFRLLNVDNYKLFCIDSVLTLNKIGYYYFRIGENLVLNIETNDKILIKKIFKEFTEYGIEEN
jgi:hypothetical protein